MAVKSPTYLHCYGKESMRIFGLYLIDNIASPVEESAPPSDTVDDTSFATPSESHYGFASVTLAQLVLAVFDS